MISILLGIPGDILSSGEYALTRVRKACHATRISKMIPRVRVQSLGPEAVRIIQRILEEIGILWRVVEQTRRINQWRIRTKLSLSTNDFSRSDFLFHFMHESFYFSDFFFLKTAYFRGSFDTFFIIEMIIRRILMKSRTASRPREKRLRTR